MPIHLKTDESFFSFSESSSNSPTSSVFLKHSWHRCKFLYFKNNRGWPWKRHPLVTLSICFTFATSVGLIKSAQLLLGISESFLKWCPQLKDYLPRTLVLVSKSNTLIWWLLVSATYSNWPFSPIHKPPGSLKVESVNWNQYYLLFLSSCQCCTVFCFIQTTLI